LLAWTPGFLGIREDWAMARRTGAVREWELQRGSARFSEWRRTRRRGPPIPVELWELRAVGLAQRQGVSRMSRALPIGLSEVIASRHLDFSGRVSGNRCRFRLP
jgi:hypothetical protein